MGPNTGLGHINVHVSSPVGDDKIDLHHVSDRRTREGTYPALRTNAGEIDTFETEMALEQNGRELARNPIPNLKDLQNQLQNQHPIQHPIQALISLSSSLTTIITLIHQCRDHRSPSDIIESQLSITRGAVSTVAEENALPSSMTGMKVVNGVRPTL